MRESTLLGYFAKIEIRFFIRKTRTIKKDSLENSHSFFMNWVFDHLFKMIFSRVRDFGELGDFKIK